MNILKAVRGSHRWLKIISVIVKRELGYHMKAYPFGRALLGVAQLPLDLWQRLAYPNLPRDRAITKVEYRGRKFSVLHRRYSDSDRLAIEQCFLERQYDLPDRAHGVFVDRVYKEIVASGLKPLIVDCGANIGTSVAWFAARFPEAHIVAVEPAPDNFELLKANSAGLDVDLREAGIAGEAGHSFLSQEAPGGEMGYHVDGTQTGRPIKLLSLSGILAEKPSEQFKPFLLKVDIEGSEKSLFEGDAGTLNSFPLIIVEPHDWMFPGQMVSQPFFRFHLAAGREFCMKHENIASIICEATQISERNGVCAKTVPV